MSLRIVIICALCLMVLSIASAESVSLPLNSVKKPAADLIDTDGRMLDAGRAAQLAQAGKDLSLLNPQDNKFWQNRSYSFEETGSPLAYPAGPAGVRFVSDEAQLPFTYMARVQSQENPEMFFRLSLSRFSHSALMRAALLRKLGYYIPSPRYYKDLKLVFTSEAEKEKFLALAQETLISDFDSRGWISKDNKQDHSLTFVDAVLEPMSNEFFDTQWGYAPDPNNPAQLATVQRLSKYRAYRSLIVPYALVDVPESINRFSPKFGSVLSGHVVLTHPSAESFSAATYEDVRWLLLKMASWTQQDFRSLVAAGKFPAEIEELVYRKVLHRAKNAFELFSIKNHLLQNLPPLEFSSSSGLVKNGKVTKELIPGYPQRFAHGDRESPFKDGDLQRYFGVRGRSMAIGTALNHINEKLQVLTVADIYSKRRDTIRQRIVDHIRTKPNQPLYQDVEAWGGPLLGVNVAAARHVTTGTYFGSSAAIQLVDNLSVSANLGYFIGVDGVPSVTPQLGANVQVLRDYTHVRPLMSISEGVKVPWSDLAVPFKMRALAKVLAGEEVVLESGKKQHPVDALLNDLREGEVFTVTDSVTLAAYAQISSSFDVLLGLTPLSYINSVSLSSDVARVILRQTSFMKMSDGVQVYVRDQKTKAFAVQFDANFFINLAKIRASTTETDLKTDAFVIDYDPSLSEYLDEASGEDFVQKHLQTQKNLRSVLAALLRSNETELLYARFNYQQFAIDHHLKTRELKSKFLAWRVQNLNEQHLVSIQYPKSAENPEMNPQDEKVTIYSVRKGELKGRDLLAFVFDWIEGLLNKTSPRAKIDLARGSDPNPANVPFGKAYWKLVNVQSDLSPQNPLPSVGILQHVWGGWHLSAKDFRKLLEEVQAELRQSPVASYRLIEEEFFHLTTAVDFYRVTAQLSVLPGGLDKLKDLITQPDANGKSAKRAKYLARAFQKLSEKLGRPARAHDLEMYEDLLRLLGSGDLRTGRQLYAQKCEDYHRQQKQGDQSRDVSTGAWIDGTFYDCMEPWMKGLLNLSRSFPADKKGQTQWMTEVIYALDGQIPLPQLLKFLGEENYVYFVRVNGFRAGDEDGDLEYFSNTLGDPQQDIEIANGLLQLYANRTRISPIELDRTQGGFR